MRVVEVTRYPLKSARGERLASVTVGPDGLEGDRSWIAVDAADDTVGSAKHPGRWQGLLDVEARATARGGCDLTIAGRHHTAGTPAADAALSHHLGRPVRLTRTAPPKPRLHRLLPDEPGMRAVWQNAAPGSEVTSDMTGSTSGHHDYGPVHLLTTGALAQLADRLGHRTDPARFRANAVLDLPADPEPGETLTLGDLVLRVDIPKPRCIVPGLTPLPPYDLDRDLLALLARAYRVEVGDHGRAACFGFYADVVRLGTLSASAGPPPGTSS